jgi:beta-glucosidase
MGTTRRRFLLTSLGSLAAFAAGCGGDGTQSSTGGQTNPPAQDLIFPANFYWGASTSAYQVEGGWNADGKGESIWDRFVHATGRVANNNTGDVACDHYHLYQQDVATMQGLHLNSYRFSISWPRVQPTGTGAVNQAGLDFYSRLVDTLLAANIRPLPTLFHWDLPQALQDTGGWDSRDTAQYFSDYADLMVRTLGDRVSNWLILNEPFWFTFLGYWTGVHAPGLFGDWARYLRTTHIANIAQGQAFQAMKARNSQLRVGTSLSMAPVQAGSTSAADQDAAARLHAYLNVWFLDPALRGQYPDAFRPLPASDMDIRSGDMDLIRAPFDFLGINCYSRAVAWAQSPGWVPGLGAAYGGGNVGSRTDNGWEVWPASIHDILVRIYQDYHLPLEITENGCAYNDVPGSDGTIADQRRIAFMSGYLQQVWQAIHEGADVRGYHTWSLMDNFEWLDGFAQRFGIVYVDFPTLTRTVKNSGKSYGALAQKNTLTV